MPGQGRLATSRRRVPNLDGVVPAAAGKLLSIGAPRHSRDPIASSQHTNRQKQREKNLKKKITNSSARSPSTRKIAFLKQLHFYYFRAYTNQIEVPFRVAGLPRNQTGT